MDLHRITSESWKSFKCKQKSDKTCIISIQQCSEIFSNCTELKNYKNIFKLKEIFNV